MDKFNLRMNWWHLINDGQKLIIKDELAAFDKWLTKTEDKLDGGKIQRPGSIVDACQVKTLK